VVKNSVREALDRTVYMAVEMTLSSAPFRCICNVCFAACLLNCSCLDVSRIIKRFIGFKKAQKSTERISNESNKHQPFLIL
jgi:hypothetical protein